MTAGVLSGIYQFIVTEQQLPNILTAAIGTGFAATHTRRVLEVDDFSHAHCTRTWKWKFLLPLPVM
jgi:hypothetical protein